MAKHHDLGKYGENLACEFLSMNGYRIKERNWRFSHAEIDIIAEQANMLVFIEVKARSDVHYGQPEEFVDLRKEKLIMDAASQYMAEINYEWEFRFDIISILIQNRQLKSIRHFKDAFFSGMEE